MEIKYSEKSVKQLKKIAKSDFKEYQKLIEASQDRADYNLTVKTKKAVKKWTSHDKLKKDLGL
jgi:aspartate ammonia-lyase